MKNADGFARGLSFIELGLGIGLGMVLPATTAVAQTGASRSSGLEEIVVTAQKREERAQETPISMTVLSGTAITEHSIRTLTDITGITPGIAATKSSNSQFGITFQIRGVSAVGSGESPVGIYVDNVYVASQSIYGTNGVALTGLLDVDRIEVLKGPQGTLYGRNTAAGAINLYSAQPTGTFGGYGTVNIGNHGSQIYTGVVNVPIVSGKVDARIAAQYAKSNGFQKNLLGGDDLGAYESYAARGTLRFRPTDDLTLTLRGDLGKATGPGHPVQLIGVRPGSSMVSEAAAETFGLPLTPATLAAAQVLVNSYIRGTTPSLDPISRTPSKTSFQTYGGSFTAEYDFSEHFSVKSISAYLFDEAIADTDYDVTPFVIVRGFLPNTVSQFTQEVTFTGTALNDRLKYAVGGFYFDLDKTDNAISTAIPAINPASPNATLGDVTNKSYAGYGQATYTVIDGLNVTGGVRYTSEKKTLTARSHSAISCLVPVADQIGGQCLGVFSTSFTNVSYTAGVDYKIAPGVLVYGKVASGFKAGGTNQGSAIAGSYANFEPEKITTYEGGVKSQFADNRVRLNVSYYHSDYTNLQKSVNRIIPPTNVIVTTVSNAASARVDGVEFEGAVEPVSGLVLGSTVGYTMPKYLQYRDAAGDHSFQKFVDTPRWTYSISAAYTVPVQDVGELRTQIDWAWRSITHLAPQDEVNPVQNQIQQAYGLLNARVSLSITKWDADIAIWGKNLTDKLYFKNNTPQWATLGYVLASVGDPRTFGVELTKRF